MAIIGIVKGAEIDFKTKFGKQVGLELKEYQTAFMLKNLDTLYELYKTLLEEMSPSVATRLKFAKRLTQIEELQSEIADCLTSVAVTAVKNFSTESAFEMLEYRMNPVIEMDAKKQRILFIALQFAASKDLAALNEFVGKLVSKWREMYAKIPGNEFNKNKNYQNINAEIEKVARVKITSMEDSIIMQAPLRMLADCFELTEIAAMLENKNYD